MEPAQASMRLRLILGKYRVVSTSPSLTGFRATIDFGSGVTVTIDSPIGADIKPGDLLTFYTEVLYAEPVSPPKQ